MTTNNVTNVSPKQKEEQMEMTTLQESLVEEFSKYISKPQAVIAVQVYLELVEIKRYYNVGYDFDKLLNKMVITGSKYKETSICAFIPITLTEYLDFSILQRFLETYNLIFLAVVATDSTTVYYQIQGGLVEPDDTTAKHTKIDKGLQLDRELDKNKEILKTSALLGVKAEFPQS